MSNNKDLYATILGIRAPWYVTQVDVLAKDETITVTVESRPDHRHPCPTCGAPCPGYDTLRRSWRHLDTCQFKTYLVADVPRVSCKEHGVQQILLPWAEPKSGFTALFEAMVIDWLKEANISAVARLTRLTWDQVYGVMRRAVKRGLERRPVVATDRAAIDETSVLKRHEYVTVVTDITTGHVLFVSDGKGRESLDEFWAWLGPERIACLKAIALDMSAPYMASIRANVPSADSLMCFDRFHVAKILNDAVNTVRKQEHRALMSDGDESLKGAKHLLLENPENMTRERRLRFREIQASSLKSARAWAIKDAARWLWGYVSRTWAEKGWKAWIGWAQRSQLEPMKRAARTVKQHLGGILNAVLLRVTNAISESTNAKIQRIKNRACGYRNRARFHDAIYFHLGGLDLYPRPEGAHTTS